MKQFIGRKKELALLDSWDPKIGSVITAIHGRRRVGKTTLVEKSLEKRTNNKNNKLSTTYVIFRFEGLEGRNTVEQKKHFFSQFTRQVSGVSFIRPNWNESWTQFLIVLSQYIKNQPTIVFFDEFQWTANSRNDLVSAFKFVWDNYFIKHNNVHVIICGSVSSFIVQKVIHSKALYGRIDNIISLGPLSFDEIYKNILFKRSVKEACEFYMIFGGIPKYYEIVNCNQSIRINIEKYFLDKDGYLFTDMGRIFSSHFGRNGVYLNIVTELTKHNFLTRQDLEYKIGVTKGGQLSHYLTDLEQAGFILSYSPLSISTAKSRLKRYRLTDPYIAFFNYFIDPIRNRISTSRRPINFSSVISNNRYEIWRGLAFERFCLFHAESIADTLGFGGIAYKVGSWFKREHTKERFQIDLMFERADNIYTICEIKFKSKVGKEVIKEMEAKLRKFDNPKGWTIEPILISATAPQESLMNEGYFSKILTLDDVCWQ